MGMIEPARIILGAASWGSDYGIKNSHEAGPEQVKRLILKSSRNSINSLDTADGYGKSESLIGEFRTSETELYTKISSSALGDGLKGARESISNSLMKLQSESVEGLAFHDATSVLHNPEVAYALSGELREKQVAYKVGVSVYEVDEIYEILDIFRPDYIQAPVSLVDRRFISADITRLLQSEGVELHARSVYLQGVLLQQAEEIHPYFSRWKWLIDEYRREASNLGMTLQEFFLLPVLTHSSVAKVVVGVNEESHLDDLINTLSWTCDMKDLSHFSFSNELALLDPRRWRL